MKGKDDRRNIQRWNNSLRINKIPVCPGDLTGTQMQWRQDSRKECLIIKNLGRSDQSTFRKLLQILRKLKLYLIFPNFKMRKVVCRCNTRIAHSEQQQETECL